MKNRKLIVPLLALGLVAMGAVQLFAAVTESSTNVPLAIPDNGNVNSTLNFSVNGTMTDANLTVNITHTWNADLRLTLNSPTVAAQILWQNCGQSGDNLTNTVIDNDAAGLSPCTFAAQPFTGSFQPTFATQGATPNPTAASGSMNSFDGTMSGGVWTLNVADDSSICTGTLNAWSLTLDGPPPLPVELMNFEIGS
ncbi:MAG TPA: proprotein convertase P-domain-containing protein [Thermoanaerobaculia bacterium]|nr:proprotein convertase P-domain-containing protein [Thermoanaerobaculia bacterium]